MIVISPHSDDILLGVYSCIKNNEVDYVYFIDFEGDKKREKEARMFCEDMKIKIINKKKLGKLLSAGETVLIPNPESSHPLHKCVMGWLFMTFKVQYNQVGFYSTDMDEFWIKLLSNSQRRDKLEMLNKYFPLEKELWENNAKYYLFEGIIEMKR